MPHLPSLRRGAVVGIGAEDIGLSRTVEEFAHRAVAELGQGPGLVFEEPLVCIEALAAHELLTLEAPEVSQLFAAGARSPCIHDLPEHRQAPLQALEEDVIQGLHISTCRAGHLADGALQARRLQASGAQRVQARQKFGAFGLGLAARAQQKLKFLIEGLLVSQGEK